MASGSPRARIDQFFASKKKRKYPSPGLKSKSSEKDGKVTTEGSPSAKGSLENFLMTSKETGKSSLPASDSPSKRAPVKRNLKLDINSSLKHKEKEPLLSVERHSETLDDVGGAIEEANKDSSEIEEAVEVGYSEMNQFATKFLSLYCSDSIMSLPSTQNNNANKRQSSPSCGDLETKSHKRLHCSSNGAQFPVQDESTCPSMQTKPMHSSMVVKSGESASVDSKEVTLGEKEIEPQSCLRKCGNAPSSSSGAGFKTPGILINKVGPLETPKSSHGSSLFSPGETFWNEAIQVADGLLGPTDNFCSQGKEPQILNCSNETSKSNDLADGGLNNNLNCMDGGADQARNCGTVSTVGSLTNHGKDLVKEVSPLPVRHFDFSIEDKNLDDKSSPHKQMKKCHIPKDLEIKIFSLNHENVQTDNIGKVNMNPGLLEVQENTSECDAGKEKVMQENHYATSDEMGGKLNDLAANNVQYSSLSSIAVVADRLDLNNWLPSEICSIYKKRGISKLYPWQVDCLQVDGVLENRNLVYCASTSAGKSFVAEILILRRVLLTGKMALLVLPYVSICAEKAEHLEVLLEPLNKQVRSYYGNQGGGTLPKDTSVAVCTIEKANSLVNRLLEEGRLSELGIIVIDELHMVGDQHRGYLLELMLTKLRYAAGEGNTESSSGESSGMSSCKSDTVHGLQIVGMSATLPNVAAVADWLHAALYETDFRPVPLVEYIKVGHTIYNRQMDIVRTVSRVDDIGSKDPDHIVQLCNEVVQEGHSVLIFCSSRKGCESTARHVAKYLKEFSRSPSNNQREILDINSAIDALQKSPAGLDPVLEETLPAGVAYHHAGLTVEERETVETCYRQGLVRVLTATSTLAAGVNLPARRVIFRQPRIGRDFIDGTRYRQMAGRAGRTGIDTKGESVLICKPEEVKRIQALLNDGCPPLHSCLSEDKNGMTHAILEVVAGGIVQTADDIHRYVRCTLLNSIKPFEDVVKSAQDSLRWLCRKRFLEWSEDTKLYTSTPLGRASFGSSLSPEESLVVLDDLVRAREGFVLASDLHLVYLVTPINVEVVPDWELYYERFMELPALDQSVGNRVGVHEPFLMRMAHGAPIHSSSRSMQISKGLPGRFDGRFGMLNQTVVSDEQILRVCRRFYVALILSRLVQELPITEVCNAFKVARGLVQSLQENAGRFASMLSVFCERLGWLDLEGLVAKFQNRVSFGVRAEIVELTTIPHVKGSRARALYRAGLRTPQAIAEASIPEIAKAIFESSSWATQGPAQKRIQLGVAKKIKNGARKIVLDKAEEARIAAFSAFKSLGLNVPIFSQPLTSYTTQQPLPKDGSTSSGEESSSSFAGLECRKQDENITELISDTHKQKLAKASLGDTRVSEKANSVSARQANILPEKAAAVVKDPSSHCYKFKASSDHGSDANASLCHQLPGIGSEKNASDNKLDQVGPLQHERDNPRTRSKEREMEKGPQNASSTPGGFDSFLDLWNSVPQFYFDIHFNKISEVNKAASFEIHGMAICWEDSPVYYINVPKDLFWSSCRRTDNSLSNVSTSESLPSTHHLDLAKLRWNKISSIMGRKDIRKFSWNLKVQIQVFKCPAISIHRFGSLSVAVKSMGLNLVDNSHYLLPPIHMQNAVDLGIVAWILWPDEEKSSSPNLEKEVKKRLSSEAAAAAGRNGRWKNQMRRAAHNGCCRRVAQIRALSSVLWKLLISEELVEVLLNIEIPLVNVLAQMELWGIGVDMEGCLHARHILGRKLRYLEKEAYKLAGMTFSLYTAADIANVLYEHLKLPVPEGHSKGKCHPSTDKHCLDLLRNEHPIIPVIREHRTLAKLLNCTLGSICSLSKLSMRTQRYTLHGHWLQTSTATGRLSMEEPNLQCVEHMVEFKMSTAEKDGDESVADHYKVNARDFFIPTEENMVLLTADYSQIELRLMAHFSKDSSLIELLSKPHGDVFTMIAAKWTEKVESSVSSQERELTKRLVYGILYGMGTNSLAEQLNCTSEEASEKIRSFKRSFPGVASWLQDVVSSCQQKGYVTTLRGRKRFLAKIKFGNSKEKSKAQRQAVNSICQGSAADIIKIAMINIHSVIIEDTGMSQSRLPFSEKFHMLQGRCRILLQVHDELVMEADSSVAKEAGLLLQLSMENAASLLGWKNVGINGAILG